MTEFSFETIQPAADDFVELCATFLSEHSLMTLIGSFDHLAFRMTSTSEYEQAIVQLLPHLLSAQYVEMDGRRVATGRLNKSIELGEYGKTQWIEVKEPKPGKQVYAGLDHAEIVVNDLDSTEKELKSHVAYTYQDNGRHRALVVVMNDLGQEIKFTDTPLEQVLIFEAEDGRLHKIK